MKAKTIQSKLFLTYSTFILAIILAFIAYYYIYTAKTLETKSSDALYQLSGYISTQLDGELQNMNELSEKILFSEPLKELFYSDIYDLGRNAGGIYDQRRFYDILYSITGPQVPVSQINMVQLGGNCVGLGSNSRFMVLTSEEVAALPYTQEILRLDGYKYITAPHPDGPGPHARTVISLDRSFAREFGKKPDSIIEIQQNYTVFDDIIRKALNTPDVKQAITQKVYVFNEAGELMYPLESVLKVDKETLGSYWGEIRNRQASPHTFAMDDANGSSRTILAFTGSGFSGWTVAVAESESVMLLPVLQFRNRTVLASVGIMLLSLALSYFVARGLTVPIKKIHRSIKDLSLATISGKEQMQADIGLDEFDDLNRSFEEMCRRLKDSLEEAVSARSHELQAQMLALQSQMNPHFLYNTITNISILAEGEGNEGVVRACMDLSGMLRYISSGGGGQVTLGEELEHTRNYLNLMKVRYQEKIRFELDIPGEMRDIRIPKLVIQPLVENCTKYAINKEPPWVILVSGKMSGNAWEVTVQDNGPGFDGEWLAEMERKLQEADSSEALSRIRLDGMGLINIYLRLKLQYGMDAVFKLRSVPGGGAAVTVGGAVTGGGGER